MRPPLAPVVSGARSPRGPRAGVALRRTLAADRLVAARTAAEILPPCLAHRDALSPDDERWRHGRRLAGKRRAPASYQSTWRRAPASYQSTWRRARAPCVVASLTACVRHAAAVTTGTASGWRHDPASRLQCRSAR